MSPEPTHLRVDGDTVAFAAGETACGPLVLDCQVTRRGNGHLLTWRATNRSMQAVAVDEVGVRLHARAEQVLEHGWQSWSTVRRCTPRDVRPERRRAPAWLRAVTFADPARAGEMVAGEQFLLTDSAVAGFLGAEHHLGTVRCRDDGLDAVALLDGISLAPGQTLALDPLWLASGNPGTLYGEFTDHWADHAHARSGAKAPVGWCTWYQYFAGVTPAHVRRTIPVLRERNFELLQIDDGFQSAVGDWLTPRAGWNEDLAGLPGEIEAAGMVAGIWSAPFLAAAGSQLVHDHPDWLVADARGRPVEAMFNDDWGGWTYALDTTQSAVLEHLRATYAHLAELGFRYHKIDFCYAAAIPGRRASPGYTRAVALRRGLEAIRQGAGEDAFVLGCGCPLGPAVGVVDGMRVSPDVAPYWKPRPPRMARPPLVDPSAVGLDEYPNATRNAVSAAVLRAPLHRRLWINDPDCLLIRSEQTELDAPARRLLAACVTGTGGFTIVSDDITGYSETEWALVDAMRAWLPRADTRLRIVDPFASAVEVRSDALALTVDWTDDAPRLPDPVGRVVIDGRRPGTGPGATLSRA